MAFSKKNHTGSDMKRGYMLWLSNQIPSGLLELYRKTKIRTHRLGHYVIVLNVDDNVRNATSINICLLLGTSRTCLEYYADMIRTDKFAILETPKRHCTRFFGSVPRPQIHEDHPFYASILQEALQIHEKSRLGLRIRHAEYH